MRIATLEETAVTADAAIAEINTTAQQRLDGLIGAIIDSANATLAALNAQLAVLQAQYDTLQSDISTAEATLATLNAQIAAGVGTLQPQFDACLAGLNAELVTLTDAAVTAKLPMDPISAAVALGTMSAN